MLIARAAIVSICMHALALAVISVRVKAPFFEKKEQKSHMVFEYVKVGNVSKAKALSPLASHASKQVSEMKDEQIAPNPKDKPEQTPKEQIHNEAPSDPLTPKEPIKKAHEESEKPKEPPKKAHEEADRPKEPSKKAHEEAEKSKEPPKKAHEESEKPKESPKKKPEKPKKKVDEVSKKQATKTAQTKKPEKKQVKKNEKKASTKNTQASKKQSTQKTSDKSPVKSKSSGKKSGDSSAIKSFNSLVDSTIASSNNNNSGVNAEETGDVLTATQVDLIKQTISKCWHLPAGLKNASDLVVDIRLQLAADGSVKSAEILDKERMSRDPSFKVAAENAYRAVLDPNCNPLPMPQGNYEDWKVLEVSFDPSEMLG
jgi:TolA protein